MSVFPSVVSETITTVSANPFLAPAAPDLILLIDDDDFIADIVEQILSRSGKRVLRARNGAEGNRFFLAHEAEISLVMVDRFLPDLDGVSICRTLRQLAPHLPIILMSGMDVPAAAELAAKGPTVFLSKPFFASQVRELVAAQLGAIT
jgi:CheY-like chemotaxis protein